MSNEMQVPKSKGRNCFVIGCLGLLAVGAIAAVVAYFAFQVAAGKYKELLYENTDDAHIELPVVVISDEDAAELVATFTGFREAISEGREATALSLSSDDINAIIQKDPSMAFLNKKVYVTLSENDQIECQVSMELDMIPLGAGRFFNGNATFDTYIRNGQLFVVPLAAALKGEEVPEQVIQVFKGKNLAGDIKDPKLQALLNNIGDLEIKDGVLTITPKASE